MLNRLIALLGVVAASTALAATAATASPQKNIVQTAAGAGQFTTLVMLVQKAGLAGALSKPGALTVFAPTDKAKLRQVLLYHVVKGEVPAATVTTLKSAKTLEGRPVSIAVRGGKVFVNSSRVVKADIATSNGIIHVVDKVLIPSS